MNIHILPQNIKIEVEKGRRLYQVLQEHGIIFESSCNGVGTCGKCRVHITKGCNPPSNKDLEVLTVEELNKGMRLACHVNLIEDIVLINKKNKEIRKDIKSIAYHANIESEINHKEHVLGTPKDVTDNINNDERYSTSSDNNKSTDKHHNQYGVAIDIGTTNIIAKLCDLENREEIGVLSIENPQRSYGLDVISRITFGIKKEENEDTLHNQLKQGCDNLIDKLCSVHHIERMSVQYIAYVGNTTMIYSFLKRPLIDLAKAPFHKVDYSGEKWKNSGEHLVLPLIQGHVGADALACIISTDIHKKTGKYLIIDIGTNGELILSEDGKITVCSTAAGPAFEAANISCGMVAEEGAITGCVINQNRIELKYIGEDFENSPMGICGSGLVDLIAKLYTHQWMDDTGRLQGDHGESNEVILYQDNKKKLTLRQKDIREFQLAKAAIATGIKLLLLEKKLKMEDLDEVYIAGALGSHISCENLFITGILPRISSDKVTFIGNAALDGCIKFLFGEYSLEEIEEIAKKTEFIELANKDVFQEEFIKNINFNK